MDANQPKTLREWRAARRSAEAEALEALADAMTHISTLEDAEDVRARLKAFARRIREDVAAAGGYAS